MADAWHHRSDAFSSVGALIGIVMARAGVPVMDSMNKMVDYACDEETQRQIYDCVMKNKEVMGIDLLQTRIFGNKIYVDVEIQANASYTLRQVHEIAEMVHDDIEMYFPKVKHIMVHVNPAGDKDKNV